VLPLLYGLGARDYLDHLGYVLEQCPSCRTAGPFAVYQSKRKLTFFLVPTVSVREQQVVECRTCGARFAVPPDRRDEFAARLLSHEELAAVLRAGLPGGPRANGAAPSGPPGPTKPTHYQTLQVDPAADPEVIEAAFRRLALKYHPDRSAVADAAERMRELLEAKAVLTDPDRRRAYNASLGLVPAPRPAPSPPPKPRPEAMRPEDV
jgi:DnaJ domain